MFLKNQKGQQIIEVLIALFLAGFFISGLIGFYQYTGNFQEIKDFTHAERHFTFIQNVFSQNCDSFVGDKLTNNYYKNHNPMGGQSEDMPQITMKSVDSPYRHELLYATSDIEGHPLSSDSDIIIKEINLKQTSSNQAFLTILFESLKTFKEYEKTMKLYITTTTNGKVKDCSLKPILPCKEDTVEINYVWNEVIKGQSINYKCNSSTGRREKAVNSQLKALKSGWLVSGQASPGEVISITDTSSSCCVCMIRLQCSEGFWSKSSDCFKRKGKCNKP